MANQITRVRLCIEVDPATGAATEVSWCKYRISDDATGDRVGVGAVALDVAGLNKVTNDAGAVGELIRDIVDAAKAQEGI